MYHILLSGRYKSKWNTSTKSRFPQEWRTGIESHCPRVSKHSDDGKASHKNALGAHSEVFPKLAQDWRHNSTAERFPSVPKAPVSISSTVNYKWKQSAQIHSDPSHYGLSRICLLDSWGSCSQRGNVWSSLCQEGSGGSEVSRLFMEKQMLLSRV